MSELSGSLEDFPLPDVMRLLAKGKKDGVLHVYGDASRGRVYLDEGRISYATTRASDDFAEGPGSENPRGAHDRRQSNLVDVADDDPGLFVQQLEDQIVDVLVRLGRETTGSFVFQNGVRPNEPVKEPFAVEGLLDRTESDLKEWERIEDVIGSTEEPLTVMGNMAADEQVTIDGMAWNAIASLAGVATTTQIAGDLGEFEINAARTMARLIEDGLVVRAKTLATQTPDEQPDAHIEYEAPQEVQPTPEPEPAVAPERVSLVDEDDFFASREPEPALSEFETREVLSALSTTDEWQPNAPRSGIGSDTADENTTDEGDEPMSELARRWRTLRAGANE